MRKFIAREQLIKQEKYCSLFTDTSKLADEKKLSYRPINILHTKPAHLSWL